MTCRSIHIDSIYEGDGKHDDMIASEAGRGESALHISVTRLPI